MNADRLPELLRQRELVREHLAWLEREISSAQADHPGTVPLPVPVSREVVAVPPVGLAAPQIASMPAAQSVAEAYEPDPRAAASNARRGCLLAFVSLVLLGCAALAAIYVIRYRDRPLLFVPAQDSSPEKPLPPADNRSSRK